ncbi:MAG: porin family protein [Bacteroidota bacterium]
MNRMKKLFGTGLALLFATFTIAQVSLGLKAGVNYANISTPDLSIIGVPSTDANRSFTFGAVAEVDIANGFAFQPEVNYSKKGFDMNLAIPLDFIDIPLPVGVKVITDLNYVEVPLLAKYNFGNGSLGGYVTAGPTMSYANSAEFRTATNFIIDINLIREDIDLDALNISRFDIGGSVGAGGTLDLGRTKLFLDARYTHGFKKLDNLPVIDLDFRNRNFAITTGFMIPIGRGGYASPRA